MAPARLSLTTERRGPFFRGDPVKTWDENVERAMAEIAEAGEAAARRRLAAGQGRRAPVSRSGARVSEHVRGRTHSLGGKAWHETALVSISAEGFSPIESLALFAAASRVEGRTHGLSDARAAMDRAMRAAELLRGLE